MLVFFILLSLVVSFLCSMLEAVILSVTPSYLASLQKTKPKLFKDVQHLKTDIEMPLASILTFNTVAHTIGAAGAGAEAQRIFGSEVLAAFSVVLTLAILFFSEIIPKSIGASSWKSLLPYSVKILKPMIFFSFPLVWISKKVSSLFRKDPDTISKAELSAMADLGLKHGTLEQGEAKAIKGLIEFDHMTATEIMTPKTKVAGLSSDISISDAYTAIQEHPYSRIVIFEPGTEEIKGFVLRTDILKAFVEGQKSNIGQITRSLLILPEGVSLPGLFSRLLKRREHICAIVNPKSEFLGVLTLEDLIEHMLNHEIYDEQDHLIPG